MQELTSIIVVGRDKFSPTEKCLKKIFEHTPEPIDVICVFGGMPHRLREKLEEEFKEQVTFIWKDEFLHGTIARNIGLKACKTKLAVTMDEDVIVHEGWLKHLLICQKETKAAMVQPLTLEDGATVHASANFLYITEKNGKKYASKELAYARKSVLEGCNIERCEMEFGEFHCHLVDVKKAIDLGIYDEVFREFGDMNAGLSFHKAKEKVFFEPASVVDFKKNCLVHPEDIRFYVWRWDIRKAIEDIKYFEEKWGIDVSENGKFINFLMANQNRVQYFARLAPSYFSIYLDKTVHAITTFPSKILGKLASPWNRFWKRKLGYYEWVDQFIGG